MLCTGPAWAGRGDTRTTTTIAKPVMTTAAKFWYVLQYIAIGDGYFAKVPQKRALSEVGLCSLTSAESFWYVIAVHLLRRRLLRQDHHYESFVGAPTVPAARTAHRTADRQRRHSLFLYDALIA